MKNNNFQNITKLITSLVKMKLDFFIKLLFLIIRVFLLLFILLDI